MKKFLASLLTFLLCAPMAYASIIPSVPYNLTNGTVADATQVMGNFNTIVSDVNANAATAGANNNITSLTGITTPLSPIQGGTSVYVGAVSGGTNAQVVATTNPASFTLTLGNIVTTVAGGTNTGATTLNTRGTGVESVRVNTPSGLAALVGGEIRIGQPYMFYWDGTYYELLNPATLLNGTNNLSDVASVSTALNNILPVQTSNRGKFLKTNGTAASWGFTTVPNVQVITATSTYTPTAGMTYALVEIWGGGGGGGGAGNAFNVGGGGGAGACSKGIYSATTIGASQTVTIGAAGAAGTSAGGTGGTGGASSFGSIITAVSGGLGGVGTTSTSGASYLGGLGGTAGSGGSVNIPGVPGGSAFQTGNNYLSGYGGSSMYGAGGLAVQSQANGSIAGNAATGYGSGGSGAVSTGTPEAGGVGTPGFAIITEFFN